MAQKSSTEQKSTDREVVSFVVRQYLEASKVQGKVVAKTMGMRPTAFSKIVNGKQVLEFNDACKFCSAVGVSLDTFGEMVDIVKNDPAMIACFQKIQNAENEAELYRKDAARLFREKASI